jgi:hypothetical protein
LKNQKIFIGISLINLLFLIPTLFFVDHRVFLPDAGDQLVGFFPTSVGANLFSAWGMWHFGTPQQSGSGKFLWFFIQSLTGSPWIAQIVITFGAFWVASMAFALLFTQLHLSKSEFLIIFGSIVYAYNWVTFKTLQLHVLWITAATPLLILFGTRIFFNIGKKTTNILGLIIPITMCNFFMNFAGTGFAAFLLLPPALARLILLKTKADFRGYLRSIVMLFFAFSLSILVNLPFFYPNLLLLINQGFFGYVHVGSGASLTSTTPLTRLFYMPTIMPTAVSPFFSLSSSKLDNPLWPIGAIVFSLAIVGLFEKQRIKRTLSLVLFIIVFILMILIALIVSDNKVVNTLYSTIFPLYIFIEAENYLIVLAPLLAISAMLGLETVFKWVSKRAGSSLTKRCTAIFFTLSLAYLLLLSSISAHDFAPLRFDSLYDRALWYGDLAEPVTSQLPQFYSDLLIRFNNLRLTEGPFKVLWLPDSVWYTQANWAQGSPDTLNLHTLQDPVLHYKLLNAFSIVMTPKNRSTTVNFGSTIAQFGYKYIVSVKTVKMMSPPHYVEVNGDPIMARGNASIYIDFFNKQHDLLLVESTENYVIYLNIALPEDNYGVFWLEDGNLDQETINSTTFTPSNYLGTVKIRRMSPPSAPSRYELEVNSSRPAWLVFNQRYDLEWRGRLSEGPSLTHCMLSGWANAFWIPSSGYITILLDYGGQDVFDIVWTIWEVSVIIIVIVVVCRVLGGFNKFKQILRARYQSGCMQTMAPTRCLFL